MEVNFGNVAKFYAKYREDLPYELLEELKLRGIDFQNKQAADFGSGTGVFTRALYKHGAKAVGVEPSIELIKQAVEIDTSFGIPIEYVNAYSEDTSLPNGQFDYVTVLRAWHWFNREETLKEIKRILKNDGTLLVMDSGFISKQNIVLDTLNYLKKNMPPETMKPAGTKANSKEFINSFPVEWFKEWKEHQFEIRDLFKRDYTVTFTIEEWCGRVASLSWLTVLSDEARAKIIDEIYNFLLAKYRDSEKSFQIDHAFYIAILERK